MVLLIKDRGRVITNGAMESKLGLMDHNMLVSGRETCRVAMECTLIQVVTHIKVNGKKESLMEKVNLLR
jgi:hypothetical protein